jgi:hypothetical protein
MDRRRGQRGLDCYTGLADEGQRRDSCGGPIRRSRPIMTRTGEDSKTRVCSFCGGSGRCERCGGAGTHTVRKHWPRHDRTPTCAACGGSGECQLCHGKGILEA